MVTLDALKLYLKELKYPGINLMSNDEIANIFSKTNRLHFLTWFCQNWNSDIKLPVDETGKSNILITLLHEDGFCSYQDSIGFVHATELSPEEQVCIFNKMLHNLKLLIYEKDLSSSCEVNYLEQMKIFGEYDLNIFPHFGSLKSRTIKERIEKLKEYNEEILKLEEEIEVLNDDCKSDVDINTNETYPCLDILDINNEIPVLMTNTYDILNGHSGDGKGTFTDSFENVTEDCNEKIANVLKLYENKKIINEFRVSANEASKCTDGNTTCKTIHNLQKLSEGILNMN